MLELELRSYTLLKYVFTNHKWTNEAITKYEI